MDDNLDPTEVQLIIRDLVRFIVTKGKHYVSDDNKEEYVLEYIQLLLNIIYTNDENLDTNFIKHIAEDITKYIK